MGSYVIRITLQDQVMFNTLEEAGKAADEWAEGLADQEECEVFYVEVFPK